MVIAFDGLHLAAVEGSAISLRNNHIKFVKWPNSAAGRIVVAAKLQRFAIVSCGVSRLAVLLARSLSRPVCNSAEMTLSMLTGCSKLT